MNETVESGRKQAGSKPKNHGTRNEVNTQWPGKQAKGRSFLSRALTASRSGIMSKGTDSCSISLYFKKRDFVCSKTGLLQRNTWLL